MTGCNGNQNDAISDSVTETESVASEAAEKPTYVELFGKKFDSGVKSLDLRGITINSLDEVLQKVDEFKNLEVIDVTGCAMSNEELMEVQDKLGDILLKWSVIIYGKRISTATKYFFLSYDYDNTTTMFFGNKDESFSLEYGYSPDTDEPNSIPTGTESNIENVVYLRELTGACIRAYKKSFDLSLLKNLKKLSFFLSAPNSISTGSFNPVVLKNMKKLESLDVDIETQTQYYELADVLREVSSLKSLGIKTYSMRTVYVDYSLLNDSSIESLLVGTISNKKTLESLGSLKKIKKLYLYTTLGKNEIKALKEELPDCLIWVNGM